MSNAEFDLEKVRQKTVANIEKILLQGGLKMVVKAKENLIENKHYVTGRLSKSVTMNQESLKLEFGSNIDYAITIETGKSVNAPNANDIREWAKEKVRLGHAPQSLIFAAAKIARNITNSGTIKRFNPFLEPAFSGELKEIREKISQAVEQ
jgi:hypothetical protein